MLSTLRPSQKDGAAPLSLSLTISIRPLLAPILTFLERPVRLVYRRPIAFKSSP